MKYFDQVWSPPEAVIVSEEILTACGGYKFIAETLVRRGINTPDKICSFLFPENYISANPLELPDMQSAVERIETAILRGERIGVWGDFDADGQTSTAVLVSGIRSLGGVVDYYIPVRARETHGISLAGLSNFINLNVKLMITCDTGITAHEAITYAREHGIETIVTDHHTLPPVLPDAVANVNSQRLPSPHPLNPLCGVGVAYKLIEALFTRADRKNESKQFLDLVAIGTVADVAALTGENRWFVQIGLDMIRSKPRPAIQALLDAADVDHASFNEEHIGFVIAPRLNALGRMGDANTVLDFLTTDILDQSVVDYANMLEIMNEDRKALCDDVFNSALSILKKDPQLLEKPAVILTHPGWPSSVLGIAASRLVETYNKPALLITAPEGETARGSARSAEGINITQAISHNSDYLLSFGGHPMAAGFSLTLDNLPGFTTSMFHTINQLQPKGLIGKVINIDAIIKFDDLDENLIRQIDRLAPFGFGNPPIKLASTGLRIVRDTLIGKNKDHLQLIVEEISTGEKIKVFWWNGVGSPLPEDSFDLVYIARSSNYRGQSQIQVEWLNAKPADRPYENIPALKSEIEIIDFRNAPDQKNILLDLVSKINPQVWAEGEHDLPEIGRRLNLLSPADALVIYTIPPGRDEIIDVLLRVKPKSVYLFSKNFASDTPNDLLRIISTSISSIIKNNSGLIMPNQIAMETGQKQITIMLCLRWLEFKGVINLSHGEAEDQFIVTKGDLKPASDNSIVEKELTHVLQETKAFRKFYSRAEPGKIIQLIKDKPHGGKDG